MLEVDCPCVTPEVVLKASGHVDKFTDLMVKDEKTGTCYRADHLLKDFCNEKLQKDLSISSEKAAELKHILAVLDDLSADQLGAKIKEYAITAPDTKNQLSDPYPFNLMFQTSIGPSGLLPGYMRPETAQGIFVNFKDLYYYNGNKLPFAAAQIGQAFRNEISPRQGLLRVREFTLAEIEHFVDPEDKAHPKFADVANLEFLMFPREEQMSGKSARKIPLGEAVSKGTVNNETLGYFIGRVYLFLTRLGIDKNRLRFRQHLANEMAHYAADCWDAEIECSYGWIECVGIADRSAYDLHAHTEKSGVPLVAHEKFAEPREVEKLVIAPVKKELGLAFKGSQKNVVEALEAMKEKEALEMKATLESEGEVEFYVCTLGKNVLIKKSMVAISKEKKKEHQRVFTPSVIEPSFGIGRIIYCLFEHSYYMRPSKAGDEQLNVFRFPPLVAPIKCTVFPLVQNQQYEQEGGDASGSCTIIRPRPEKKDPALLTREEVEAPRVWSQICLQRMVDLAKESTTMRRVLDPMFIYFDSGRHWVPQQGLALMVLSDILYFTESLGNQHLVLASVIRHLDHKNVSHDPQFKSCVIQVASNLARQIRSGAVLADIGSVSDLCRHLRKSLQVTVESVGQQELDLNISLQNSIEDCLIEIAKGIGDARPLYDLMAISLENLTSGVVARATIGSLMVLAHMISLAPVSSDSQQVFPEALLVQILKAMLHPDIETRIGAHQIFSVLVFPSSNSHEHETASVQSGSPYKPAAWHSNAASASTSASITALLDKLRREKDGSKEEKTGHNVHDNLKSLEEDWKQRRYHRNYPTFHKIHSIIDRKAGSLSSTEAELQIMKFSEDQLSQLLSAFWIQANLPDNLPSNIEAIANSFVLTLISARLKSQQDNLAVRFFQLPLSLRNVSLEPNHGTLHPSSQRSVFILSMGMLLFAAKLYHIPHLNHLLKSLVACDADPYLVISEDLHIYLKPQADLREYGSVTDNELAQSYLSDLRNKVYEADNVIMDILAQNLSVITELDKSELAKLLFEGFTPDDPFLYGPQSMLDFRKNQSVTHSKESLSFDGDLSNLLVEDEVTSEASVADIARFIPRVPPSPSISHIMGIGQLLESALEVAGQVAGTSVSTSPLPYNAMASQCEALGSGTRKKLSNWLAHENHHTRAADGYRPPFPVSGHSAVEKILAEERHLHGVGLQADRWLGMRLPPASPFDNFLKAAGC